MDELLTFADGAAFRQWLTQNCLSSGGVWLLFGKSGVPATVSAAQALEEALCFGWIDGVMQRIDAVTYKKYFAPRRDASKWSQKNKALVAQLEKSGRMTDYGRQKVAQAQKSGHWDTPPPPAVTDQQIAAVAALLQGHEPAHTNFQAMSPSVRRTYTRAYLDAKTDAGRARRLAWMIDRLDKNLKPM
ncbi:MAG: YdeI/OmpD-associated family protein [Eubacteriales bacterium]|nr:YdeI/OmpD-associated family protein [Eubacteriales bacterium]